MANRTNDIQVTLEIGPKGKKVVAVAPDWPGLERGARTGEAAIERLLAYVPRYAPIAKLAGMPAQDACAGFKNLGQCMATAHVSQNLGIPFASLKDTELGLNPDGTQSTTAKPMSLGKAIQTLAPQADSKTELKKANQQSKDDADSVDGEMDSEF